MGPESLVNPTLQEIRARGEATNWTDFTVEGHRHGLRGCRCLSCDVTTGYMIGTGVSCDEVPAASDAYDNGCLCPVLTEEQADSIVQADADRSWLLGEVRRLEDIVSVQQRIERRLGREVNGPWPFQVVRRRRKEQE
jgi:hypothetical protein